MGARVRLAVSCALVAWLYFATLPYYRGLHNPNEVVRVYMTVAAVKENTFAIDSVINQWGGVDDKSVREGKLYSGKAPLQSLVGIPSLQIGLPLLERLELPNDLRHTTYVLRFFASQIPGLLFAIGLLFLFRRRAQELDRPDWEGIAIGIATALGTMHYPYGITFTGHIWASLCAGGSFLLLARRANPISGAKNGSTVFAGFLAGAAPFAEYPSALVALPGLLTFLLDAPRRGLQSKRTQPAEASSDGPSSPSRRWRFVVRDLGLLSLGGAPSFALGLWAHQQLWGSPWATGYSFLENAAFKQVVDQGFFGVSLFKTEALLGTLFSADTGLFFFSPFLAAGLLVMVVRVFRPVGSLDRRLALTSLAAFILSILFMGSYAGWRGGWTVGPRYIIALVPVLAWWCVEGLRHPWLRSWIFGLAGVSIILTGPASAIYPHLSDVFDNPLLTFVLPAYLRGDYSYGIAHGLGLSSHAANAIHLVPLLLAAVSVAFVHVRFWRQAIISSLCLLGCGYWVYGVQESQPAEADRENRRLMAMWEPRRSSDVTGADLAPTLGSALEDMASIAITRENAHGQTRACLGKPPCKYGEQPWQRFTQQALRFDGLVQDVLFLHPIAHETVRATVSTPPDCDRAILRYGLTDESIASGNKHLVKVSLRTRQKVLAQGKAGLNYGLQELDVDCKQISNLILEIQVENDGARVFGWDILFKGQRND